MAESSGGWGTHMAILQAPPHRVYHSETPILGGGATTHESCARDGRWMGRRTGGLSMVNRFSIPSPRVVAMKQSTHQFLEHVGLGYKQLGGDS